MSIERDLEAFVENIRSVGDGMGLTPLGAECLNIRN